MLLQLCYVYLTVQKRSSVKQIYARRVWSFERKPCFESSSVRYFGSMKPQSTSYPTTLLNRLKYSALNVNITLVGSCILPLRHTLKLTSNNYILHCFCIFCAVPHCHPLSPHWERSPGLPDRIWKTTMRFVGKSSYMTWWMIKERGNPGDSPIQTILEMKLLELLNEIIFLATFNKQSIRVLEKCNNTFWKKTSNYNLISSHSRLSFFKGSLSSPHIAVFWLRSTCPIARSNYMAPENQHTRGKSSVFNWTYNGYSLGCSPSKDVPDHQDLLHFLKH